MWTKHVPVQTISFLPRTNELALPTVQNYNIDAVPRDRTIVAYPGTGNVMAKRIAKTVMTSLPVVPNECAKTDNSNARTRIVP